MSEPHDERESEPGIPPGSILAGRFRVERKLGEGGMGVVYAAVNVTTNRPVALKVMHPEHAAKKDIVRRFMREAKAATVITHPNVIEVLDVVDGAAGEPIMVMELLNGEPLDAVLERTGPLALGEVARVMTPVVSAVGAAHARGIIHRDLKPENIFLARGPDGRAIPKVLDFGIAKILDPTQINEGITKSGATRTGSMLGTPYYMSVEQACGEKDLDHRTDVWSIGVILYVMLAGRRPCDGDNFGQILKSLMTDTPPSIGSVVAGLPADVVDIVDRSMSKPREGRPHDLREVYAVLARYCELRTAEAPPAVSPSLLARDAATSQTLAAASMYTSAAAAAGATGVRAARGRLWMIAVAAAALVAGFGGFWLVRGRGASGAVPVADSPGVLQPATAPVAQAGSAAPSASASALEPVASASASAKVAGPAATAGKGKGKPGSGAAGAGAGAQPPPQPTGGGIIEKLPY
jgi:serine/threonine-protein kinase